MPIYHLRASSIAELLDCPLRWYARHILGKRIPASAPAVIGTAVHRSTAAHDLEKMRGTELAPEQTVEVAYDYIAHPEQEIQWGETTQATARKVAARVHRDYVHQIAPTRTYLAVEMPLSALTIDIGEGISIRLTGTVDRLRTTTGDAIGIADYKTGRTAIATTGKVRIGTHLGQLGVYDLLAEHTVGSAMTLAPEIVGMTTAASTRNQRVATRAAPQARAALVGNDQQPGYLQFVRQYFQSGLFPPNPSSNLCSATWCPHFAECPYHD